MVGNLISLNGVWQVHPEPFTSRDIVGYAAVSTESDDCLPVQVR